LHSRNAVRDASDAADEMVTAAGRRTVNTVTEIAMPAGLADCPAGDEEAGSDEKPLLNRVT